jgi:hypothetical protein
MKETKKMRGERARWWTVKARARESESDCQDSKKKRKKRTIHRWIDQFFLYIIYNNYNNYIINNKNDKSKI